MSAFPVTAEQWNAFLDRSVAPLLAQRIVSTLRLEDGGFVHPWHTTVRWNDREKRWECQVRPGFVNGLDVTASIRGGQEDRRLTDMPDLALDAGWRRIGADAEPDVSAVNADGTLSLSYEPVPEFFVALGVASRQGGVASADDPASLLSALAETSLPARRLRAVDLVLHHDRPGLGTDAQGRPTLRLAETARRTAYLRVTKKHAAEKPADPLEQLAGNWTQSTRDSLHVATVFMLSPEGLGPAADVDETWQPFVKHELFWNLCYALNLPAFASGNNLTLQTGLAGGVADPLIQQILDDNNAQSLAALDFLTTTPVEGRFWSV